MAQLPCSNLSPAERLVRIREAIGAGCTRAELYADVEVLISVLSAG